MQLCVYQIFQLRKEFVRKEYQFFHQKRSIKILQEISVLLSLKRNLVIEDN